METQLETTLVEKITQTALAADALSKEASDKGREAIFKARECGQYLIKAREAAGKKNWTAWHSAHVRSHISYDTADRYMKLALIPEDALQQALSLRQAYIAAGILPEPVRVPGSQNANAEGQNWLTGLLTAWEKLNLRFEKKPLDGWTQTDRTTLKEKLRPMVELYAKL